MIRKIGINYRGIVVALCLIGRRKLRGVVTAGFPLVIIKPLRANGCIRPIISYDNLASLGKNKFPLIDT